MRSLSSFLLMVLLLSLTANNLNAQKLTGVVYDKRNQKPVSNANVYLEGSSLHDVTNTEGTFEIMIDKAINLPLVISHISYNTTIIFNPFISLPDTIFIDEKEISLDEIIIETGKYSRNQKLKVFRNEFLGKSQSAASCVIENEEKIDLYYDSRNRILSASCDEPILIYNKYLGYKLYLKLNKFEVKYPGQRLGVGIPIQVRYEGSTFFEDLAPTNKKIAYRRSSVFEGSAPHFLRTLANNQLEDSTYWLFEKGDKYAKPSSDCFTVADSFDVKKVYVNKLLRSKDTANYHGRPYFCKLCVNRKHKEDSEIIFFTDSFSIDAWGNINQPDDLLFRGFMGRKRIGDMLPADYGTPPSEETKDSGKATFIMATERLQDFANLLPKEKIYIHQDRSQYITGETIWFKAYQKFSKESEEGSSILYVELTNSINQTVATSKWKLEDGIASGHIELPDTLSSGPYQLKAYTHWTLNFGEENFFTREIQIYSSQTPVIKDEEFNTSTPPTKLHFFPEGGNLVEGLPSRVAFKITDNQGTGLEASGVITDQTGKEVRPFQTLHNGMGIFNFIPEPGKQYTAHLNNHPAKISFPEAYSTGIVTQAKQQDDKLRVTLRHNLNIAHIQSPFYLTAHHEGRVFFTTHVDMKHPLSVIDIPGDKLPDGIFTITVYDENLHAYCERLVFVNYPEPLQLYITTDQKTYGKREKVTIQINTNDKDGFSQAGNFSLAVINTYLDNPKSRNNYYTDYFLQSELKGNIEDPASYFKEKDSVGLRKLNLLLLTHGWRKYSWNDMMLAEKPDIQYPIEKSLGFNGKVEIGKRHKEEQVNITAIFRQDSINEIAYCHPETDGSFLFDGYHFCDTAEVLLSAIDNKKSILNLVVKEPVFPKQTFLHNYSTAFKDSLIIEIFGTMPDLYKDMEKRVHQLPDIQVTARTIRHNKQRHNSEHSLSVYNVNKDFSYMKFDEQQSGALAILEHVPKARMLQMMGKGVSTDKMTSADIEPYFLLDGIRVNKQTIASTSARMISRVEVLSPTSAMLYGSGSFAGAIAFYTKDWDEINKSSATKTVLYKFPGYNQQKEFYSPDYSNMHEYINRDHRKTLFWQPQITVNTDGKAECSFFTSDDTGEYIIHCEGISTEGEIGVSLNSFSVF